MEPWQSWTAAIIIGGAATWYYSRDSKFVKAKTSRASTADQTRELSGRRRQEKDVEKRKEGPSHSAAREGPANGTIDAVARSKKAKIDRTTGPNTSTEPGLTSSTRAAREPEQDANDTEWAQQLEARKKGVTLAGSTKPHVKVKSNKKKPLATAETDLSLQSTTNATPEAKNTSSLGPHIKALDQSLKAADSVSDMLEAAPAPASVLRITGEEEAKSVRSPRLMQAVETKKQRQNRKKAEERKLLREEQESERRVIMEKQRRQAREARGEPARNGLGTTSTHNAWLSPASSDSKPAPDGQRANNITASNGSMLLDTFDQDVVSTTSSNEVLTASTTPATAASTHEHDLPSEEAQIEMLNELSQDIGWNEVSTKGKKGKKRGQEPESSTGLANNESAHMPSKHAESRKRTTTVPAQSTQNGFSALMDLSSTPMADKRHPDDSEWAVL